MAEEFGGVTLAEIEATAQQMPFPDNAGATPSERFLIKVSALVRVRSQQGDRGGVAVFLRSESLSSDAEGCSGVFHPVLAIGNDPISNKVWLSNATLGGAYALNVECNDPGVIFKQVQSAGFGKLPALIIDWRGAVPAGQFYARGLNDLDEVQEVLLFYSEITREDLKACLDRAHQTALETPHRASEGHAEKLWNDASKGWPAHRPEERIQAKLINHLRARYTAHVVRAERKNEDGITDLMILAHTTDVANKKIVINEWILELKALTHCTETGNPVSASDIRQRVEDGLVQSVSYKKQEHARNAALCCYDMRLDDEGDEACFSRIRETAEHQGIELWRWFLHRTTKGMRTEKHSALVNSNAAPG